MKNTIKILMVFISTIALKASATPEFLERPLLTCFELTDHGYSLEVTTLDDDIKSTLRFTNLKNVDVVALNVCRKSLMANGIPFDLDSCNNVDWVQRWSVQFYSDMSDQAQWQLKANVYYNEKLMVGLLCRKY